ncbi:MAG: MATE family efflux transporter [Oscillospiraceae bacterium]|nr:MATE family efflux transporter [Oscillospiraceae bacterium]
MEKETTQQGGTETTQQEGTETAQQKGTKDMTKGAPWRCILFFALPLLAGNILQQIYNMADTIFVGQVVGETGLAGLGTTGPVILMITSLFVGIGLGAAVLLSQYYVKGDLESLRRLVATVYSLLLPLILGVMLISIPLISPLLRLIQVPEGEAFDYAYIYMLITIFGFLGSFGFNLNAGIMQAMGNSIVPFVLLCISVAIDLTLNFVFILGFGWGVAGSAISTVIGQTFSWVGGLVYMRRRYPFLKLSLFRFEFHWKLLKKATRLGLPSGVNQTLFQVGAMVMQGLVNAQGTIFMAGFSAAIKIDAFAVLPIQSLAAAVTTFVAQNIGAGRFDRVKKGLKSGIAMAVGVSLLVAALVWGAGPHLLRVFIYDEDPLIVQRVVDDGLLYLRTVMPFYVLLAAMFIFHAVLRGAGQMMLPMVTTLICLYVVRVPLARLLTATYSPGHMFYAFAADWAVGLLVAAAYFATGRWKKKRLVEAHELLLMQAPGDM